jgi:hypothetical protein
MTKKPQPNQKCVLFTRDEIASLQKCRLSVKTLEQLSPCDIIKKQHDIAEKLLSIGYHYL